MASKSSPFYDTVMRAELERLWNAVAGQCYDCRYVEAKGGRHTLRYLIANCDHPGCALYAVRPYQGGGR